MTPNAAYDFTCADNEQDFHDLATVWSGLLATNPDSHPFLTFDWQWSWWQSYADKNNDKLNIIVATDRLTNQVVGIAPLLLARRAGLKSLRFIGTGRSDYLGFVTAGGGAHITIALLTHILRQKRQWDYCQLSNISDPTFLHLLKTFSQSHTFIDSRVYERAPYLPIEADFAAFIKSKTKVFRKNIRRYSLSDMENGKDYTLEPLTISGTNAEETVALFSSIERKSWKYAAGTAHLEAKADMGFWVELLPRFERNGWLSAWLLHHNNEPVAFIIGFKYNNKMYTHTSAYAQTDNGAGNIVRNNLIKTAFDLGLKEFDFMCGDETYKLSWTDKMREVHQAIIAKPAPMALAYFLLIRLRWRLARSRRLHALRLSLKKLSHRPASGAKDRD